MYLVDNTGKIIEVENTEYFVDADGKYVELLPTTFFVDEDGKYAELVGGGNPLYMLIAPYDGDEIGSNVAPNYGVFYTEGALNENEQLSKAPAGYGLKDLICVEINGIPHLVTVQTDYVIPSGGGREDPIWLRYSVDGGVTWTTKQLTYDSGSTLKRYIDLYYDGSNIYLIAPYESDSSGEFVGLHITTDLVNVKSYLAWSGSGYALNGFSSYNYLARAFGAVCGKFLYYPQQRHASDWAVGSVWKVDPTQPKGTTILSVSLNGNSTYVPSITEGAIVSNGVDCMLWTYQVYEYGEYSCYLVYGSMLSTKIVFPFTDISSMGAYHISHAITNGRGCYADGVWIYALPLRGKGVLIYYSYNITSWTKCAIVCQPDDSSTTRHVYNMQYINGVIYMTVNGCGVYSSADKGLTWTLEYDLSEYSGACVYIADVPSN